MVKEQIENKLEKREITCKKLFRGGIVGLVVSAIFTFGSLWSLSNVNSTLSFLDNLEHKDKYSIMYMKELQKDHNLLKKAYFGGAGTLCLSALLAFGAYRFSPKYYRE